jgi:hypothetical protein
MRLLAVVSLLLIAVVVVAVGEFGVVVSVRVPVGTVLELAAKTVLVVMADVIMIVSVGQSRMSVLGFLTFTVSTLLDHALPPYR